MSLLPWATLHSDSEHILLVYLAFLFSLYFLIFLLSSLIFRFLPLLFISPTFFMILFSFSQEMATYRLYRMLLSKYNKTNAGQQVSPLRLCHLHGQTLSGIRF
jgi:hypothetical protein